MLASIEIDDELMKAAMKATGGKTEQETVELALKTLIRLRAQEEVRQLRGKVAWEGDLNLMRADR